jgi:hypothetical protein
MAEIIRFYVTWSEAEQDGRIEMLWVEYDAMIADKPGTVAATLDYLGFPQPETKIASVIESLEKTPEKTQRNKGVAGRGLELLSDTHRDRIASMTRHYPWVDFSRVLPVEVTA